ncbi:Kelch repeat-containing protein [Actinoplanes sp. CA-142083]|uniref:Kelch repeat-containing protein n=1 Tax=Actinoplanes sp. CA-142083 TaxID=3239903 RepID=UPI003D8BD2CC
MAGLWIPGPPLNVARGGLINATFKTAYAIGGFTTGFGEELDAVERLDRDRGRWARVTPMPTARGNPAAAAAGERIYVFGGFIGDKPADVVEVLDPTAGAWQVRRPLPGGGRGGAAAAAVGERIYLVGGFDADDIATGATEAYDAIADVWHSVRPMPTRRGLLKLAVVGGQIYAIGGRDDNAASLPAVERYDPATDTWHAAAPMSTGRGNPGIAVAGGRIYAVGGQGAGVALRTTERYDPAADRWETLSPLLAVGRSSLSADHVVIGGRDLLIAFGGFEIVGGTPVASARVESLAL